jgi:hypothetical protein
VDDGSFLAFQTESKSPHRLNVADPLWVKYLSSQHSHVDVESAQLEVVASTVWHRPSEFSLMMLAPRKQIRRVITATSLQPGIVPRRAQCALTPAHRRTNSIKFTEPYKNESERHEKKSNRR